MDYTEKSEKIQSPSYAIDGTKTRTIREAKRLTQLYVASVVGVTTDTISRWENNRSPSIKRDNAEKLAGALEVELAEILKDDGATPASAELPEGEGNEIPAPNPYQRRRYTAAILVLLFALACVAYVTTRSSTQLPTASRWLPVYAAPGSIIPVKIQLQRPAGDSRGVIIKEHLPEGWKMIKAVPAAATAGQQQEIKWLIPAGDGPVMILYTMQAPSTAVPHSHAAITGEIIRHETGSSRVEPVLGAVALNIAGVHWADQNGDYLIDDTEIMPAYYLSEEFKDLGLEWKQIETIWNSRGYEWDRTTRTMRPLK
jgi:transcriptional regulator with XRE-family HTH domain